MEELIQRTIAYVRQELAGAEAGHDWFHIERVYRTALTINAGEQADALVVSLAALLHDIADPKFHNGDEELGPKRAKEFMNSIGVPAAPVAHVTQIIRHMSFKNSFGEKTFDSPELRVVQDADRLDAIGAIGIARAFTYGGFKNRVLYDPAIQPEQHHSKDSYKNTTAPTINHFYEKLLLLKDSMNTRAGQALAEKRHEFMLGYLEQFYGEWEGRL